MDLRPPFPEFVNKSLVRVTPVLGGSKAGGRDGPVGEQHMGMPVAGITSGVRRRFMDAHVHHHAQGQAMRAGEPEQQLLVHLKGNTGRKSQRDFLGETGVAAVFGVVYFTPEGERIMHPGGRVIGSQNACPRHAAFPPVIMHLVAIIGSEVAMPIGRSGQRSGHEGAGVDADRVAVGDGGEEVVALAFAQGMDVKVVVAGCHRRAISCLSAPLKVWG